MRRWATRILLLLVLGAIVNVTVAWVAALWSSIEAGFVMDATADETLHWRQRLREDLSLDPSDDSGGRDDVRMCWRSDRGFGYEARSVSQVVIVPSVRIRWHEQALMSYRAGWPMAALAGERWQRVTGYDRYLPSPPIGSPPPAAAPGPAGAPGAAVGSPTRTKIQWQRGVLEWTRPQSLGGPSQRIVPLHPHWPGFAINTVFYAAVLWLLFAAPFALRRWRRIRRGLCPNVGMTCGIVRANRQFVRNAVRRDDGE
jgi:hypothetical protein